MQNTPETLYTEAKLLDRGIMPKPRMAFLTPTYHCNQSCSYCFYKDWNNTDKPEATERIPEILQQLKDLGVQGVEFEGGGDPLMTKGINEIFFKATEMGLRIGLLTNGALFKGKIAETFLKYGTYVRISLDTVDKDLYKKIRGTDDLPIVLENIKNAIELKNRTRSQCDISIKVGISNDIGYKEIHDVYEYFDGWGISNIQVKNLWDNTGRHFREDINKVELYKMENFSTPVVKKVVYPKFMTEQCWITPVQIAVDVYGSFYLCPYYMDRKDGLKVGNMFETPLKELWGSEKHKEVIRSVKISECLKYDCRFQKFQRVIRSAQRKGNWDFL